MHKITLQEFKWPFKKFKATFKGIAEDFEPWIRS